MLFRHPRRLLLASTAHATTTPVIAGGRECHRQLPPRRRHAMLRITASADAAKTAYAGAARFRLPPPRYARYRCRYAAEAPLFAFYGERALVYATCRRAAPPEKRRFFFF